MLEFVYLIKLFFFYIYRGSYIAPSKFYFILFLVYIVIKLKPLQKIITNTPTPTQIILHIFFLFQ